MTAPAVIAAIAIGGEGAGEIAGGEGGDAVFQWLGAARGDADIRHRLIEGVEHLADLGEPVRVIAQNDCRIVDHGFAGIVGLFGMGIVAADLDEEDLASHAETAGEFAAQMNETGDHFHLAHQSGTKTRASVGSGDVGGEMGEPRSTGIR